jgi:hypothetical protein
MRMLGSQRTLFLAALLACSLAAGASSLAQPAQGLSLHAVPIIIEPVDETKRITRAGNSCPSRNRQPKGVSQ